MSHHKLYFIVLHHKTNFSPKLHIWWDKNYSKYVQTIKIGSDVIFLYKFASKRCVEYRVLISKLFGYLACALEFWKFWSVIFMNYSSALLHFVYIKITIVTTKTSIPVAIYTFKLLTHFAKNSFNVTNMGIILLCCVMIHFTILLMLVMIQKTKPINNKDGLL